MSEPALAAELARWVTALVADEWRERKAASQALQSGLPGLRQHPDQLEALCEALIDRVVATDTVQGRAAAHEVLVAIGAPALAAVVERLHRAPAGALRLIDLIGAIGGEAQVPLLAAIVGSQASDDNARAAAAQALGGVGGERAVAALRPLLASPVPMLQAYALDALRTARARIGVTELAPLLAAPATRRGAIALLGLSGEPDAVPLLVGALSDELGGVRSEAALALARLHATARSGGSAGRGLLGGDPPTAALHPARIRDAVVQLGPEARARVRELIEHRNPEVQHAAMALAGMAGDASALAPALRAMADPELTEAAVELVSALGPAANAALVRLAEETGSTGREALHRLVAGLVVDVVDPRLLEQLAHGLKDVDPTVAEAAAEALQRVGGRASLGPLYQAMGEEGGVGEAAADAFAAILARVGGGRNDDLTLLAGPTFPAEGPLARNLCRVVGRLASIDFVPRLVNLLGSTDRGARVAAAQALGQIPGEHEGVVALSFALADEEATVRAATCRSLGALGAPRAVQPLLSATADPSPLVRAAAVQALVAIDNPIAVARMREIIADDPVPSVVVQAIAGLGKSGLEHDLNMLMSLCTSADHEVVKAAARALQAYPAHRATAALLGLLDHDRWDVRWAAAEVLAARGDVTAIEPLRQVAAQEHDELVRQVVMQALARLTAAGTFPDRER